MGLVGPREGSGCGWRHIAWLLLHSCLNHEKKGVRAAEITMATKVPNPVDKYVGSRVRMRRQMLGMS